MLDFIRPFRRAGTRPPDSTHLRSGLQPGITLPSPKQRYVYFVAFDLRSPPDCPAGAAVARACSWIVTRSAPYNGAETESRLSVTVGFGTEICCCGTNRQDLCFEHDTRTADFSLPPFAHDDLRPEQSGGDLLLQCGSDVLAELLSTVATLKRTLDPEFSTRWEQLGFADVLVHPDGRHVERGIFGFLEGISNIQPGNLTALEDHVVVGPEALPWLRGGTYIVIRKLSLDLDRWENLPLSVQERVLGRTKADGIPLGGQRTFEPVDSTRRGADGLPLIASSAHIMAVSPIVTGSRVLRRGYNYVDVSGERVTSAGLLFVAYQRSLLLIRAGEGCDPWLLRAIYFGRHEPPLVATRGDAESDD